MLALLLVAVAPAVTPPPTPPKPERKICRTYDEIGSRIRKQRTCMTAAEWRKQDDVQQGSSERMLESRRLQTITR